MKKTVSSLFSKVFLCILGDIQYRLTNYKDEDEDDNINHILRKSIQIPPHIKSFSYLNKESDINVNASDSEEESKSDNYKNDNKNSISFIAKEAEKPVV